MLINREIINSPIRKIFLKKLSEKVKLTKTFNFESSYIPQDKMFSLYMRVCSTRPRMVDRDTFVSSSLIALGFVSILKEL